MSCEPRPDPTAPRRARELAVAYHRRRQQALITRQQAIRAGWSPSAIDQQLRCRSWERHQIGVYGPAGLPRTFDVRLTAAWLRLGPGAVAVGLTAARLWGLPDCDAVTSIALAVPRREAPRLRGGALARGYPWLSEEQATSVGPHPVLTPDQVLVDLAALWDDDRLLDAAADLWRRGRIGGPHTVLAAAAVRGAPRGVVRLRRVLARLVPAYRRTRSVAEVRAVSHLRAAGIDGFEVNLRLRTGSGRRWEYDLVWRDPAAIVEVDGAQNHLPSRSARDRLRDRDAGDDGYHVRRLPAALTADRGAFVAAVRAHLAEAAARP